MSEVPIIPIPIGGIGGRIISILKDFIDRFINFFRFIGKTIDRLIQRVTSNRLWRIMARFIKLLTNPKLSIPLLAGLSLMFTMLVHVAEEHEDTVKLLKQNVDKWINNVYKTIRNVADYLWHEDQYTTVNNIDMDCENILLHCCNSGTVHSRDSTIHTDVYHTGNRMGSRNVHLYGTYSSIFW